MDATVATSPTTVSDMQEARLGRSGSNDVEASSGSGDLVEKPRSTSKYLRIPKSLAVLGVFLLLGSLGSFAYTFMKWRKLEGDSSKTSVGCSLEEQSCEYNEGDINDLNGQIDRLQDEIDRLEASNGQLADQLLDYGELNDRLNASIAELQLQNEILSDNNDNYEALNGQLSETVASLQEQNTELAEQVATYAELNENLNATLQGLEIQVDRLEGEVIDLTGQNDRLEALVGSLQNETDRLWNLSNTLQEDVDRLEGRVEDLTSENDRLEVLIGDLENVASFLDETSGNLDQSFEAMASFLSEQITTSRRIGVETLENLYQQRVLNWDCALRDRFALEAFATNGNLEIPGNRYDDVIDYVDEKVLTELCLNRQSFVAYFENRYAGQDLTINGLIASVQRYTGDAIEFYFPEEGELGLSESEWANASYNCENLPQDLKFVD